MPTPPPREMSLEGKMKGAPPQGLGRRAWGPGCRGIIRNYPEDKEVTAHCLRPLLVRLCFLGGHFPLRLWLA